MSSILKLTIFLLLKALLLMALAWISGIGLGPDEAQYWTWSERLAAGYYSKPPGIAWQIAAGTAMLGNTEAGVRLFAQIIGFLFPLIVYFIARTANLSERQAFFAGLITTLSPIGWLSSLLAITDGGLILFWCLALLLLIKEREVNYIAIGFMIACGALFKWPIYWFWLLLALALPFVPRLRSRSIFTGIGISLLGLIPSIIWNISNNWATFRHVEATIVNKNTPDVGSTMLMKGNFWDFLGAQAALISPILFILLLGAIWTAIRHWKQLSDAIKTCFIFSIPPLALFLFVAIFKKMQGNWCEFAYPGAIILIAWYASERWIKWGLALSCTLVLLIFSVPALQKAGLPLPYKLNPFKHNMGWTALSGALEQAGYDSSNDFLFSDKYQTTSVLWFYGPKQHPTFFFNLQGIRLNQFSFWPGMEDLAVGKTGYFVIVENEPYLSRQRDELKQRTPKQLKPYFDSVEFLGEYPLFLESKNLLLWKCKNYNGKQPSLSDKY
jgi:4-amino-4-deoxy-L-arabinose transferase-like glycosyltransferase